MKNQVVERLHALKTFPSLVKYLRDELDWPIESEDADDITFEYEPEELGLEKEIAVKIKEIKQLRPLSTGQPWGIFYINFEPKRLPVVVLRRILQKLVIKKRASANKSQLRAWELHDLLFISSYGEDKERSITFAHFSENLDTGELPTLRVLGWDDQDTVLHLDYAHTTLKEKLSWPDNTEDVEAWRERWSEAFTLRHREVITTSKELAIRLASLATRIRKRVNAVLRVESDKGAFRQLHQAFREALIHDLNEDDFADMYAQTITYGLLAARVSRPTGVITENLAQLVSNPFLKEALSTFLALGGKKGKIDFDEVGILDVVDLLNSPNTNVEAVLRDFGNRTQREDPVIHFYELFLTAYDKKKKVERGVFYTPQPVVSYIVRSVHELLQSQFGLEDGLASTVTWGEMANRKSMFPSGKEVSSDFFIPNGVSRDEPFVQILDPAAGTGTFLVEVIDVVAETLIHKWELDGHRPEELGNLWGEYVAKHLLPRLYGYELMMAPYVIADIKLTLKINEISRQLGELFYRGSSKTRFNIYLTNSLEEASQVADEKLADMFSPLANEAKMVNAIKREKYFTVVIGNPPYSVSSQNDSAWIVGLCEDFKKGLEGERNIQPLSDDYIKFLRLGLFLIERSRIGLVGMITNREYLQGIIHRTIRKRFFGAASHIFICDLHGQRGQMLREGEVDENLFQIGKGVSIGIFSFLADGPAQITYSEIKGLESEKSSILASTISSDIESQELDPSEPYWFFQPWQIEFKDEYMAMPSIVEYFKRTPVTGFATHRDHFAIDFSKEVLAKRLRRFLDSKLSDSIIQSEFSLEDTRDWHLHKARINARKDSSIFSRIIPCTYRPFDFRWVIYSDDILEYSRRNLMQHVSRESPALICSRIVKDENFAHGFVSSHPVEKIFLSPKSSNNAQICLSGENETLLDSFIDGGASVIIPSSHRKGFGPSPRELLQYIYAVLYSLTYRGRYTEFLKIDFPRVPLTFSIELFNALAKLGGDLVALHLMESPKLDKHITKYVGKELEVEKITYSDGMVWIDQVQTSGFKGVPENVWKFHIGGYKVCEKWLKERRGRKLSEEDIEHYHRIVVALNETIRLMAEIDKVIDEHGGWPIK